APIIAMSCRSSGLVIEISFAEMLEDTFPAGDLDIVSMDVGLDNMPSQSLAFRPSSDWGAAYSIDQSTLGANVQTLAVQMFGGLFPSAKNLNMNWKAPDLARQMKAARQLTIRA